MVRFSDLKGLHPEGKTFGPVSGSGTGRGAGHAETARTAAEGLALKEPAVDRDAVYEDASFYLGRVFNAVKDRKKFALDPGFRIMRQIVESHSPQDTLFVKTIQVDDRLNYLINKCINVGIYAVRMADRVGLRKEKQVEIGMAGLLHEVGMCLVPEKILYKKERLTEKEFELIQRHSEFGYEILKAHGESHPYLAETALQIHERIDGSGYPQGLQGDEIHEYAQILGLVDIYEALSHSRPQRDRFNHFYAIKEIIKTCKHKFQKKHLKALLNAFSIFPLSTYVRLNSNAVGKVIETYPDQPMRPRLQIEYDSQGRKVLTERIVNLPENSLLYIVDSVSDEDLGRLENGLPIQRSPEQFKEREFSPPESAEPKDRYAREKEPSAPRRSRFRQAGQTSTRPLLSLILLVLLVGGIPFWQGRQPVIPSVAGNRTSGVELASPAAEKAKEAIPAAIPVNTVKADGAFLNDKGMPAGESGLMPPTENPAAQTGISDEKASTSSEINNALAAGKAEPAQAREPLASKTEVQSALSKSLSSAVSLFPPDGKSPAAGNGWRERQFPFSLLLSSFRSAERAGRAMAMYRDRGVATPYCVRVNLGADGIWYRVFSGFYASREEAAAAAEALPVGGGRVKKVRYANWVDSSRTGGDTEAHLKRLREQGFLPYQIATGGDAGLFVGAFYTLKGARDQQAALDSKGVASRIVER